MKRVPEKKLAKLAQKIEFPPLKITRWKTQPVSQANNGSAMVRTDAIVEVDWEGNSYQFVVEIKPQASPKVIDQAITQVKSYISQVSGKGKASHYYPMLIAPYLSEDRLEKLAAEKISGLDLSGNGVVIVPGKIFVYRSGAKNKFPSNAPIKNVFRGISSIVPRVFLAKPEYSSVNEVLQEITARSGTITIATVSKVLKTLEEELLILRSDAIRLLDGKGLLKKLRENYRRPAREQSVLGKVAEPEKVGARLTEFAEQRGILCAIDDPRRYAVMASSNPVAKLYAEDIDSLLSEIEFTETDRFANLELIESRESAIYFDRRREPGERVFYTSPVQSYLELAMGGKREQETAAQIAEGILNFRY